MGAKSEAEGGHASSGPDLPDVDRPRQPNLILPARPAKNPEDRLAGLLKASGATLERQNKHLVYKLPNGRRITVAKTPSDRRATLNTVSALRKAAQGG